MPTVAVTGGAGFVGRRVTLALRMAGCEPYVIDPTYHLAQKALDCPGTSRLVEAVASCGRDVHAVIHLAGPVGTYGVVEQRGQVAKRILSAAHAALALAETHDCPLINVSTSEVYGLQPRDDLPVVEHAQPRYPARRSARLAYATAKLAAENDLHTSIHRTAVVTVRPFNISGPGQDPGLGFVIPRFVDAALADAPLTVFGDGVLRRCFMHVDDLARLLVLLVAKRQADGYVLNAAGPARNETTTRDLAFAVMRRVERLVGACGSRVEHVDGRSVFGPDWEEAAAGSKIGDSQLAKRLVGWEARATLDAIIDDAIHDRLAQRAAVEAAKRAAGVE